MLDSRIRLHGHFPGRYWWYFVPTQLWLVRWTKPNLCIFWQRNFLPMAGTGNTPPHRRTRRREQGRPEGPPVRYPQGSDNRGNLAATRGAALGTASGALLLTGRAHNCGALMTNCPSWTDEYIDKPSTAQPATAAWADPTTDIPYALSHTRKCAGNHVHTVSHLNGSS